MTPVPVSPRPRDQEQRVELDSAARVGWRVGDGAAESAARGQRLLAVPGLVVGRGDDLVVRRPRAPPWSTGSPWTHRAAGWARSRPRHRRGTPSASSAGSVPSSRNAVTMSSGHVSPRPKMTCGPPGLTMRYALSPAFAAMRSAFAQGVAGIERGAQHEHRVGHVAERRRSARCQPAGPASTRRAGRRRRCRPGRPSPYPGRGPP